MILGCYYHNMRGEELKNFRKISKSFVNRWQRTNLKLATRPSAPKQVIGRFNLERLVICSHLSLQLRHAIIILKRFRYFLLPVIKKTRCSVVPLRMRSIRDMIGTSWLWILILISDLNKFTSSIHKKFFPHPIYNTFGNKLDKNKARQNLQLTKNEKYLLFFGFVREYKGLDLLLNALADKRIKKMGVKLIVASNIFKLY